MMSPQTQTSDRNNKLAWSFLKSFRKGDSAINLVAIDPNSGNITGITRPVTDTAVYQFIERHNGKRNLYFMVNTPKADAPDKKLKKEHVEFINAVWLDADPAKDKPFEQERERLQKFVKQLQDSEHLPTYIVDSGGGFQAFWCLSEPVLVTPEMQEHYEGLNRALALKYGTDNVHNIDRIMRLPYTWNLPTARKKEQGRKMAFAKVAHAASKEGVRYD
jgi:hypothetical protein